MTKYDGQTGETNYFNFSTSTSSFGDTITDNSDYYLDWGLGPEIIVQYQVQAHYGSLGDSPWSNPVLLEPNYTSTPSIAADLPVSVVAGPQGSAYLVASALPAGTVKLVVTRVDYYAVELGDYSLNTNLEISISALTNGLFLLPSSLTTPAIDSYGLADYEWHVQTVDANNNPSESAILAYGNEYLDQNYKLNWIVPPYFDGRTQLKQNLIFLLRAATVDFPFYYKQRSYTISNPDAYAYSGFNNPYEVNGYLQSGADVFSPFQNNYIYRNFVFDSSRLDTSGYLWTGVGGSYDYDYGLTLANQPTNRFQPPITGGATIPALLATNETRWLCSYPLSSSTNYLWEVGITSQSAGCQMAKDARNIYGLPFLSANISGMATLLAGGSTSVGGEMDPGIRTRWRVRLFRFC